MDESFVVLPPGAGSMYGQEGRRGGGNSNSSLDARMTALTKVFQIASRQTQVEGGRDSALSLIAAAVAAEEAEKAGE